MTWGPVTVPVGMAGDFAGNVDKATQSYRDTLAQSDLALDPDAEKQLAAAVDAAKALLNAGVVGGGYVVATLSGHASPGGNWNGVGQSDGVTISLNAADAPQNTGAATVPEQGLTPGQTNVAPISTVGGAGGNASPAPQAQPAAEGEPAVATKDDGTLVKTSQEVPSGGTSSLDAGTTFTTPPQESPSVPPETAATPGGTAATSPAAEETGAEPNPADNDADDQPAEAAPPA